MNESRKIKWFIVTIFIVIFLTVSNMPLYSVLGAALFLYFSLSFYLKLGKTIEIRDLIIVIALLQWIIGPIIKYRLTQNDIIYYMGVPEKEYMSFVFPASLFYILGLYFPLFYKKIESKSQLNKIYSLLQKYPNIDLVLIFSGLALNLFTDYLPQSIRFFVYLISLMRYTGLFFLALNKNRKHKWLIFSLVILTLFAEAVRDGIFHELILWLVFLFIFIAFLYQIKNKHKLIVLIFLSILIILIQTVKFFYRQEASQLTNTFEKAELLTEMMQEQLTGQGNLTEENNIDAAITRINQGWIVARIMQHTPRYEPFADGETIITGIRASLIPRFLDPNKPKAGGKEYFTRFTGKLISKNTSMGLSPLGEAYANFGVEGGVLFMFLLGLFYNVYFLVVINMTQKHPSLILWIPLLFLQVVKAETDFVVVLNHLVKASIVVSLIIWSFKKFFNIKL